ncbi:DUF4262 domain-containing protein [Nocardioides zeae]|uniref:DUF4262 domain-containing protein n=1 Tax=Nocardioides zeae TaxID=1457234 RepID=A0AAJ1U1J6_9ACTN|nr:DUF4262 domain-containing protein [Nocardioides zeae]MDQ1106336.1 hypothetical protein [Nocardioides zeae]
MDQLGSGIDGDELVAELAGQARMHGHAIIAVAGGEDGPSFAYTVGLAGLGHPGHPGHPELLVVMESQETAYALLNDLAFRVRDQQVRLDTPVVFAADATGRYDAVAAPVPPVVAAEHVTMADTVARAQGWPAPVAVTQVHLMDGDRHWPWETSERYGPPVPGSVLSPVPDVASLPRVELAPYEREVAPGLPHDTVAHVCLHVQRAERPARYVFREDGGWSFVCGEGGHDWGSEVRAAVLGRLVELDPTLAQVLDLPDEHEATRDEPGAAWVSVPSSSGTR